MLSFIFKKTQGLFLLHFLSVVPYCIKSASFSLSYNDQKNRLSERRFMELSGVSSTGIHLYHSCTQLLIILLTYIEYSSIFLGG